MRYSPHRTGITAADLAELVADATATTAFRTPDYADTTHSWPIDWGPQLDIRPLGLAGDQITSEAVAAYLAKYATKATEPTGLPITARMTAEAAEHYSDPDTHLGRLVAYAFQLGTRPRGWNTDQQKAGLARHLGTAAPLDPHARLRRPLRHQEPPLLHHPQDPARRPPHLATHPAARLAPTPPRRPRPGDDETTLIVCDLTLAGIGWNTTADAQLAADAAARAREHRALAREERTTPHDLTARNQEHTKRERRPHERVLLTAEETAAGPEPRPCTKSFELIRTGQTPVREDRQVPPHPGRGDCRLHRAAA